MIIGNVKLRRVTTVREECTCNDIKGEESVKEIPTARGQTSRDAHYTYQQGNTWYFRSLKRYVTWR
jgi:hypothetical protein